MRFTHPQGARSWRVSIGEHAPEIAQCLRAKQILVRDWSYDPHLKGYLRFTIGSTAQIRRLIEELTLLQHLMERREGTKPWRNITSYDETGWFA